MTPELPSGPLVLGCASMMGFRSAAESARALDHAWSLGIRQFDTAHSYGYGMCEEWLGSALGARRKDAWIISKYGIEPARGLRSNAIRLFRGGVQGVRKWRWGSPTPDSGKWTPAAVTRAVEHSLRSLRVDRLGLFLLHSPPADLHICEAALDCLGDLQSRGLMAGFGVSCGLQEIPVFASSTQAIQFGFNLEMAFPAGNSAGLRLINHVFGGREGAPGLRAGLLLRAQASDPALAAELRGDPALLNEALLRLTLRRARASGAVIAMFDPGHQRLNYDALYHGRLTGQHLASMEAADGK